MHAYDEAKFNEMLRKFRKHSSRVEVATIKLFELKDATDSDDVNEAWDSLNTEIGYLVAKIKQIKYAMGTPLPPPPPPPQSSNSDLPW